MLEEIFPVSLSPSGGSRPCGFLLVGCVRNTWCTIRRSTNKLLYLKKTVRLHENEGRGAKISSVPPKAYPLRCKFILWCRNCRLNVCGLFNAFQSAALSSWSLIIEIMTASQVSSRS